MALAEPQAYGDLGLKPWEFWRLTRREYELMADGRGRLIDDWWTLIAQAASWILAGWVKKPPTAAQLLGRKPRRPR